jgi:hypothetical protein
VFKKKGRIEDINLLKEIRRKMVTFNRRFEDQITVEDIQKIVEEINSKKDFS